tara:strand:+ start:375 stop:1091 length:717 start_codon:yes stop_codon:yes gene_type:complete
VSYKGHIVIVEDDFVLRKAIVNCYQKNYYYTTEFDCPNGVVEFIEQCEHNQQKAVDIIVTDIVMPDSSGYELIESLKNKPDLGKIFISVNGALEDKIKGLRLGVDDYIVKPINSIELLLRTESLLARIKPPYDDDVRTSIQFLNFQLNPESRVLSCQNQVLELGHAEHQLLLLMIGQQGNICSKQQMVNAVYRSPEGVSSRTIDKLVSRLRKKLCTVGGNAEYIITQRGKGCLLVSQV